MMIACTLIVVSYLWLQCEQDKVDNEHDVRHECNKVNDRYDITMWLLGHLEILRPHLQNNHVEPGTTA